MKRGTKLVGLAAMLTVGALQLPMLHVTASAAEEAAFSVAENVSVQYRTLAADMTTKNQAEIEAGTVAATVSIDHNAGFRAATLVFDVSAGYEIVTDAFGEPLYHSDAVLDSFQIAATASDSENKLCVAVAAAKETQDTGAMLTLYLKPSAPSRSAQNDEIISVSDYTAPVGQTRVGAAIYGEINGDQIIDANDAAYILDAYVENNERALLVEHLTRVPTKGSYFFPNAASPICADCVQPEADGIIRVINMADSREVLKYGSASGAGNTYTGKVGTPIDTSNLTPGTFTGTPRVVYEYTMDVPFVNNDIINGHGTCWLATLVAKHNYFNRNVPGFVNKTSAGTYYAMLEEFGYVPGCQLTSEYLGMSHTYVRSDADYVEMYNHINYENPVYMGMGSHAVLLCGIKIMSDGTGVYTFMDSNYLEKQEATLSAAQMRAETDITYKSYTWREYRY